MRNYYTLTFNEESWVIQPFISNPKNLGIFKNGIMLDYYLEPILKKDYKGFRLHHSDNGNYSIIRWYDYTEINFDMMADLITTINNK